MGPILLGIILLCIHQWVAIPYPLDVVCLIAAIVAIIYGLYVIFVGAAHIGAGHPRYNRRYWY